MRPSTDHGLACSSGQRFPASVGVRADRESGVELVPTAEPRRRMVISGDELFDRFAVQRPQYQ